jgi:hypothetical protein
MCCVVTVILCAHVVQVLCMSNACALLLLCVCCAYCVHVLFIISHLLCKHSAFVAHVSFRAYLYGIRGALFHFHSLCATVCMYCAVLVHLLRVLFACAARLQCIYCVLRLAYVLLFVLCAYVEHLYICCAYPVRLWSGCCPFCCGP